MSNTINSLNAIYTQQIAEDEDRVAITPEDAAAVGQHVRAIKYEARKSGEPLPRAYNTYVGKHNLTATQRRITKEKLGLAEEVEAPIKIKPKEQKEDFIKLSDWRYELREVDMPSTGVTKKKRPTTSEKSREKITEKPINNKVEINPTMNQLANSFNHELHAMGGQLLEMVEIKETMVDQIPLSPQELIIQRRMAMLNMRLARKNREKVNKIKKDSPGVVDPAKLAKKPPEEKKVEEEVGISSTEKMQKALKDAALRRKEQQKVAKKKSVKEELSDRAKKEVERDDKNVDNPLYKPGRRTVKQLAYARELALKKKKVDEGVGRAAIGAGVGAIVGGPVGAAAGAALGASMGKKKVTGAVQKKKPVDIADPHGNVAKAKKKVVGESRDSAGGDLDKEPPSWASMNPEDRGNPAYMKTSSLKDEEKWKRLQKMRKASKKKEVRAKANEEVQVDEEKKALPKLKMYRKAGNLARAGDEKSMKRQTKIVSTLNKETSKGYKKAALDKLRDGGSPKHQTEDKAFANVVAALKKKHGDAGVLSSKKDFDDHKKREASKPTAKQIQKKDERTAAQREVDAQYGRTPWNKKGSLGT